MCIDSRSFDWLSAAVSHRFRIIDERDTAVRVSHGRHRRDRYLYKLNYVQ